MMLQQNVSEGVKRKIQLYVAALYLFDQGKSHPQVIEMLSGIEPDLSKLAAIADKAMKEEWDTLYKEARVLFTKGMLYEEVLKHISQREPDSEIAEWICGEWYELKTFYADCAVEGPVNRFEGMKWIIICSIVLTALFYFEASWFSKGIWIVTLILSTAQWIAGIKQRSLAQKISFIFSDQDIHEGDMKDS